MKLFCKVDGRTYQFERPEVDSRGFHLGSWAKYCPICLGGWAHMTAVIDGLLDGSHSVRGQLCADCGQQVKHKPAYVPGSLLEEPQMNCQTLDWDLLLYLPRELLLREFYLHDRFFSQQDSKTYGNTTEPYNAYTIQELTQQPTVGLAGNERQE